MTRYAITNRILSENRSESQRFLIQLAGRWGREGIDFVQLREKDLGAGDLVLLAKKIKAALSGSKTKLLINGRMDVAVASGADGVHLTSGQGELTPIQVKSIMKAGAIVSRSCHSIAEVQMAVEAGVDLILYGPVFEKRVRGEQVSSGQGLEMLHAACQLAGSVPLLALGGVDAGNAMDCQQAGAAGIAGIRMFL